jgi:hypothetical protein
MVYELIARSPWRPGLLAAIARGLPPARLDSSVGESGPHAFAVRVRLARHATQAASIAFHPAFVAIAIRPSMGWNARIIVLIWGRGQALFTKIGKYLFDNLRSARRSSRIHALASRIRSSHHFAASSLRTSDSKDTSKYRPGVALVQKSA